MYGIFYEDHMVGITIYQTEELAKKALRTQYGNSPDYETIELEVIGGE